MANENHTSVFISYARKDGIELALRLQRDLEDRRSLVWLDKVRISGGASWTEEIERGIDESQVMLAVLTPGAYVSDICRAEQTRALRKQKTVIPILAVPGTDRPLHLETRNYRDFTQDQEYAAQFQQLLRDIEARNDAVQLQEQYRSTYVTAPPLPRNYIQRREALVSLRNALMTEEPGPGIALTALRGMGGIGKTILAQALSHDEVVQQAFPDGIFWTTVGKASAHSLMARMQEVRRGLGDTPAEGESELQCINRYRNLLRDKAALVIVDDVWRTRDVEPFLADSPRSRLLFTTRNADIGSAVGAGEHLAGLLTEPQSRALLARWSGRPVNDLPPEAGDLIRECGRLPLALSMTGAMLCRKPAVFWSHVLQLLRTADIARIKAELPNYPHTDLLRAIQVSVDAVDDGLRRRYLKLAVLLDDMAVRPAVQQSLWGASRSDALATAEQLIDLSLAQRDGDAIRLHDLQLDYVRAQWPTTETPTLELIRGAVRLSADIVEKDPNQFASQLAGRLLPFRHDAPIRQFLGDIAKGVSAPWIRPLNPALHPPGTGLLRTFEGHTDYVYGVAVTPDGKQAVSASADHTLKLWDVDSGRVLHTLEGHTDSVYGVAVTPDGKQAVSASADHTLKLWDLNNGRVLGTLEAHSACVSGVAVTPDGKRAVSASGDHTLKVWDLDKGRMLRTLEGHSDFVHGVAVTPDGKRAVSASGDHTLKVWDLDKGCVLSTLEDHSNSVSGVTVTPDGTRAISASWDQTLKVWDLDSGRVRLTLEGHSHLVHGVAITADGKSAVSASWDQTLKMWDLDSGHVRLTLEGHSNHVHGVAVTPDGHRAVSASGDDTLKLWDLDSGRVPYTLEGHSRLIRGVSVTPDGKQAVSASWDTTLKLWDLDRGRPLRTLEGHSGFVSGVAVTSDGKEAVSASWDQTLKVWDLDSGRMRLTLEGHSDFVDGVAVAPDGTRAVSASRDQTLRVWDLSSGRVLVTLKGHSDSVHGVALTPDGKRAVSASADKTLKVWDLDSGCELRTLKGHSYQVCGVALTPNGKWAVSASADNTLKVWDLDSGCELRTLKGHSARVAGVAVTPDGTRAVSASWDKTIRVWDLDRGHVIASFCCDHQAHCCTFVNDHRIIAGDAGGRVHILSLELP